MDNITCEAPECERPAKTRRMCSRHYQRLWRGVPLEPAAPTECRQCGGTLPPPPYGQVPPEYCSKRCQNRRHYVASGAAERKAARNADRRALLSMTCPQCSKEFAPARTAKQVYCSPPCARKWQRTHESGTCAAAECDRPVRAKALCNKHYKAQLRLEGRLPTKTPWTDERRDAWHRRRALLLEASTGEPVILAEIAERDAWVCGLCERPVDAELAYPDPMSKSLDHIVPLTKGGEHDPSNAQLAHLRCNVSKGNRAA